MRSQALYLILLVVIVAVVVFFVAETFRSTSGGLSSSDRSNPRLVFNRPCGRDLSGIDIALDDHGYIYMVAESPWDPESDDDERSSGNSGTWVILTKLDASGTEIWSCSWPGSPYCVATDNNGSVYIAGRFEGIVDFDPGEDRSARAASEGDMVFLSKLESSGEFQWVRTWGEVRADRSAKLAVDDIGNVYITGVFARPRDVERNIAAGGCDWDIRHNIYLHKFDTFGETQWRYTGPGYDFGPLNGVDVDAEGNILLAGCLLSNGQNETPSENGSAGCNCGDVFISKFDQTGDQLWTISWPDSPGFVHNCDLAVTREGTVYVVGDFSGELILGSMAGDTIGPVTGDHRSAFAACFDSDGDPVWLTHWKGEGDTEVTRARTGVDGGLYVVGQHIGPTVIRTADASKTLESGGDGFDSFLVILSPNGEFRDAWTWGGNGSEYAFGLSVDRIGNAYVAGDYHGSVELDFAELPGFIPQEGVYVVKVALE